MAQASGDGRTRSVMRAIVPLVALVVAACLPPAGRVFQTTLSHDMRDLPVALGDQTDLVVRIEPAEADVWDWPDLGVVADQDNPDAFVLTWLGGACDGDAAVSFQRTGSGFALRVEVRRALSLGCPAVGIPRALRIITAEPIPIGSIVVTAAG